MKVSRTAASDRTARSKPPAKPPVRRRAKSSRENDEGMSRAAIIRCAIDLARSESIDEVSMVRVAREMGVAAGLIHYYMGSRDDLLSAVLNHVFQERVANLPALTGDWRGDLEAACRSTLRTLANWPGVANYIATRNRFRLFQRVGDGEADYGLAYFDRIGQIFRQGGFSAEQAALAYDMTMMFVTSLGVEYANHQAPRDHRDFIVGYVSQFDPQDIPGATFLVDPFSQIDNDARLNAGMTLLLDGFESWLPAAGKPRRRSARKSA